MTIDTRVVRHLAASFVVASILCVEGVTPLAVAAGSAPPAGSGTTLSGEAARKSEPGRAVVALIEAARKGDRTAVRNLLLPAVVKDLDENGDMVMEILATMADDEISEITIEIVDADLAKGTVTKREGSMSASTGMTIERVAGAWKISL